MGSQVLEEIVSLEFMDENNGKEKENVETLVKKEGELRVPRKRFGLRIESIKSEPIEDYMIVPVARDASPSKVEREGFFVWDRDGKVSYKVKQVRKPRVNKIASMEANIEVEEASVKKVSKVRVKRVGSMEPKLEDVDLADELENVSKPRGKAKEKEVMNLPYVRAVFEEAFRKHKELYFHSFWKSEHAFVQEIFPEAPFKSFKSSFMVNLFEYLVNKNTNVSSFFETQPLTEEEQHVLEALSNFMCLRPVDFSLSQRVEVESMRCFYFLFLFSCYTFFEYPEVSMLLERFDDEFFFDYPSSNWTLEEEEAPWDESDSSYGSVDPRTNVLWQLSELRRLSLEAAGQSMEDVDGRFFGAAESLNYFLGGILYYEGESERNSIMDDFKSACADDAGKDGNDGCLYVYKYEPESVEGATSKDKVLSGVLLKGKIKNKKSKNDDEFSLAKKELLRGHEFDLNKGEIKKIALAPVNPMDESAWYGDLGEMHPLYLRVSEQDLRSAHVHKLPSDEESRRIQKLRLLEERGGND